MLTQKNVRNGVLSYKKVLSQNPQHVEARTNLGTAYHKKGMLAEAISEYQLALTSNPNYAGAHNNLAMAYFKDRKYTLAIQHCDQAIALGFRVNPKLLTDLQPYR